MTRADQVDDAIERLVARADAEGIRREIEARLAIEREDLVLGIRAPWLDPVERRRIVVDAVRRAWCLDL